MVMAGIQYITDELIQLITIRQQRHKSALHFMCRHKFAQVVLAELEEGYRYTVSLIYAKNKF